MTQSSSLGLKILELRKNSKMTQGDLANKIGISRAAISQFEKGDSKPSYETLAKLSNVLGLDLTALVNQAPSLTATMQLEGAVEATTPSRQTSLITNGQYSDLLGNKTVMVLGHNTLGDYIRRMQEKEDNPEFKFEDWRPQHEMSIMTVPPSLLGKGVHIVFPVIGKAMEPNFIEEDSLLCSFVPPNQWDSINRNSVCAIVSLVYGLIIARIDVRPDKGTITCVFDNTRYRIIDLDISRVKQIFQLKWHLVADLDPENESYLTRKVQLLQQELDELKNWGDRKNYGEEPEEPLLRTGLPPTGESTESPQAAEE